MTDFIPFSQKDTNDILRSKLEEVAFSDPLSEEAKKTRRNLLSISLLTIVVALYRPEIKTIFSVGFPDQAVTSQNMQGIACLMIAYFLIKYVIEIYVDYQGWRHQLHVVETSRFISLIKHFEDIQVTVNQRLTRLDSALRVQQSHPSDQFSEALYSVDGIAKQLERMNGEVRPLLTTWNETIIAMGSATLRKDRARKSAFWLLEVLIPIGLGALVLIRAHHNIWPVLSDVREWILL
jgi:hypothetical protein